MDTPVLLVFILVYAGMILGRIPGLAIDRTGIALLGAIVVMAMGRISPENAWDSIDFTTIGLLLGLMVISAQLRLGGFYSRVTRRLASAALSPAGLVGALVFVVGGLSAILANDIVCLAMTPILVEGCAQRRLNPVPYLLALACASNVGSAATLIGNPQNILIGQALSLSFTGYLADALVPSVLGLGATWGIVVWLTRGRWELAMVVPDVAAPTFDAWQSGKGIVVAALLVVAFLFTDWPREVVALAAAGVLLLSRRMHTRSMLGLVDWMLLVLFSGLFIVNHVLQQTGMLDRLLASMAEGGMDLREPGWLFGITVVLSNLVSNVPAVMLLLPVVEGPRAGALLALASTLAGNLILVGSIANLIVVDQAARLGVTISWRDHARVGVPVTLATLAIAAVWLMLRFGA